MGTASTEGQLDGEWGMIPRAIRHLYRLRDERGANVETTIRCAFLEILNEEVRCGARYVHSESADFLAPVRRCGTCCTPTRPART